MGYGTALSGLGAASQDLDVIGNNVANAGTVGFKQSTIDFADVYANSMATNTSMQIGTGTKVAQVAQNFSQGTITSDNNPLDVAINGEGFFRMDSSGTVTYTRNGQFQLDKNGYVVNANGDKLTGYAVGSGGTISTGALSDLQINTANMSPKATSTLTNGLNLNSTSTAPVNAFSPSDPTSYNNSTSATIYDSLGNPHTLQTFYSVLPSISVSNGTNTGTGALTTTVANPSQLAAGQTYTLVNNGTAAAPSFSLNSSTGTALVTGITTFPYTVSSTTIPGGITLNMSGTPAANDSFTLNTNPQNSWHVYATLDGSAINGTNPVTTPVTTLTFSSSGALTSTTPTSLSLLMNDGSTTPQTVSLAYTGSTQYGSTFSVNAQSQNGYAAGQLSNFSIGQDGTITGNYTNTQTAVLGQVALANFTDPNGLQSLGNNQWVSTSVSGQALVGVPGSSSLGVLQSSATEGSNVDLTSQLVNMITAQRDYQANAQTIKTEEALTQTLINLR